MYGAFMNFAIGLGMGFSFQTRCSYYENCSPLFQCRRPLSLRYSLLSNGICLRFWLEFLYALLFICLFTFEYQRMPFSAGWGICRGDEYFWSSSIGMLVEDHYLKYIVRHMFDSMTTIAESQRVFLIEIFEWVRSLQDGVWNHSCGMGLTWLL